MALQRVLVLMYCSVRVVLRSDQPAQPASPLKPHHSTETASPSRSLECRRPRSHSVNVPLIRRDDDGYGRVQPLQLTVHSNIDIVMDTTAACDTHADDDDDNKLSRDGAGECCIIIQNVYL